MNKPLDSRIRELLDRYRESANRLHWFVDQLQEAIDQESLTTTNLAERMKAVQRGEEVDQPVGDDVVAIPLSEDDVDLLVRVLDDAIDVVAHFPGMLLDMALIYLLATFEAFVGDLVRELGLARPEIMKSGKQMTYEEIIDAGSKAEIVKRLADQEVADLTYKSLRDQSTYLRQRFGLELEAHDGDLDNLAEAFGRRNLLVHNAGVVNEVYLRLVGGDSPLRVGERIVTDFAYWTHLEERLRSVASHLADQAISRFAGPAAPDPTARA